MSSAKRDELRAHLFDKANTRAKSEVLTLFGVEVELRQPSIGAIMDAQEIKDPARQAANMIIKFAYVPGTDEKVFEEGDVDSIIQWPFGEDLKHLQDAIGRLTSLDVEAAQEDLEKDPLDKAS